MTGHYNQISLGGASRELIDLRNFCSERLFHEHVFACVERVPGEGEVAGGWGRDHYGINAGIFEHSLMRLNRAAERKIRFHKKAAFCAWIHNVLDCAFRQG
jgi:hypothetical protein